MTTIRCFRYSLWSFFPVHAASYFICYSLGWLPYKRTIHDQAALQTKWCNSIFQQCSTPFLSGLKLINQGWKEVPDPFNNQTKHPETWFCSSHDLHSDYSKDSLSRKWYIFLQSSVTTCRVRECVNGNRANLTKEKIFWIKINKKMLWWYFGNWWVQQGKPNKKSDDHSCEKFQICLKQYSIVDMANSPDTAAKLSLNGDNFLTAIILQDISRKAPFHHCAPTRSPIVVSPAC